MRTHHLEQPPAPTSSRLIDFERVEIITLESFPPESVLVVSGVKAAANVEVSLNPLAYVRQPEYWGIEVVGTTRGENGSVAPVPYQDWLSLPGVIGTKGIEVIGAGRSERRDVAGDPKAHLVAADVFELRGDGAELTYRSADDPDHRLLRFAGGGHERTFSGGEIRVAKSELGEVVTVCLRHVPDEPPVRLTLLVPPVNLGAGAQEAAVETVAVIGTDRLPGWTAQPPQGQLIDYESFALTGTAVRGTTPRSGTLLFSRDGRHVDGQLRELRIAAEGDDPTFIATLRTADIDRVTGDETEPLAAGLVCSITDTEVRCSRDDRPADGPLMELVVARAGGDTFDATLRTAFFDPVNGVEVDKTVEIAAGLRKR